MVSVEKVKLGINNFIDKNILSGYNAEGWKGVVIPAFAVIGINAKIDNLLKNNLLTEIGVLKDGMVDVDTIAVEIKKRISDTGLVVEIPMFGSAKFYRNDVDELLRMIKENS